MAVLKIILFIWVCQQRYFSTDFFFINNSVNLAEMFPEIFIQILHLNFVSDFTIKKKTHKNTACLMTMHNAAGGTKYLVPTKYTQRSQLLIQIDVDFKSFHFHSQN